MIACILLLDMVLQGSICSVGVGIVLLGTLPIPPFPTILR